MYIEKLSSGKYRATQMVNGERLRVTFDKKPTQSEAKMELAKRYNEIGVIKDSFKDCALRYIEAKSNILSPSTEREYYRFVKLLPKWFLDMPLSKIKQKDVQVMVNEISACKSPKTVRNYHGFVAGVLFFYNPELRLNTTLPQKKKLDYVLPNEDDVEKLFAKAKNTDYEICLILMANGLRRSEICALDADSVGDGYIHVDKAKVLNKDKEWIIKSTKTTESERDVFVPQWVCDRIKEQGYAYNGHPNNIEKRIKLWEQELGIPEFSPHKLRHYYVAQMSEMGIDRRTIMESGGWKSTHVMDNYYDYSLKMRRREEMKHISEDLNERWKNL